jgi:mannose-6-phosphate isomerase-like protein (cupin superfamily)
LQLTNDILRPGGPPAKSVGRTEGKSVFLGTVGVRHIVDKVQAEGHFSVLEHPMSSRALASALHRHHNEDEYSWIIEGRVGALLGDEVLYGGPGDFLFKPRGQWHTFWNAGDEPARILEIISWQDLSSSSTSFLPSAVWTRYRQRPKTNSVCGTNWRWMSTVSPDFANASA